MTHYNLTHLEKLEAETIFIMREVAAQFENPCLLFSGGKDSIVMGHLARKAFYPAKIPFLFLHIDTGHNFSETLKFRDNLINLPDYSLELGLSINYFPGLFKKKSIISIPTALEMKKRIEKI